MIRIDLEQGFYGQGFTTGALLDIDGKGERVYRSWLLVLGPHRKTMQVYATQEHPA